MTDRQKQPPAEHPLAPLSLEEIEQTSRWVKTEKSLTEHCRFPVITLKEPTKAEVESFEAGNPCPRRAELLILNKATQKTFEAVVNITSEKIESWREMPFDKPPYGQAPIMVEEFELAVEVVLADPEWRAAAKRRGLADEDFEKIQVDPWSFGYWDDDPRFAGKRLMRAVAYYREKETDNAYAHPIEGLVAIIDLNEKRIIDLVDDGRDIQIPKAKYNYDSDSQIPPRGGLKPLHITQPEGVSFSVDGWTVEWQKWKFRVGFTPREGLVLYQIGYQDGDELRPIIHRASVTDMAVPYADTNVNHYWKCAFDGSEYGLGRLANSLELGCDCKGAIHYFDIPSFDDFGEAHVMKNAICMHEEDYGTLWKHYEFRSDVYEMRRSRRLVISFFATVGNYDYGFYWNLYQDGSIQLETKLTGIIQTAAFDHPSQIPAGAGKVTPNLYGPTHQHFFGARLHMNVDGGGNSVEEIEYHPRDFDDINVNGTLFDAVSTRFKTELEACREANGAAGRYWKVINPNRKNAVGEPTAYKLKAEHHPTLFARPGSTIYKRAGFARNHVWVTPFHPSEMSSAGDYANQHQGDGVQRYVEQNRPIDNTDIVLWHTFGVTHTCRPEDFPVMPVEYTGFWLKPQGFFDTSPAMDVPAEKDVQSIEANSTCCER